MYIDTDKTYWTVIQFTVFGIIITADYVSIMILIVTIYHVKLSANIENMFIPMSEKVFFINDDCYKYDKNNTCILLDFI